MSTKTASEITESVARIIRVARDDNGVSGQPYSHELYAGQIMTAIVDHLCITEEMVEDVTMASALLGFTPGMDADSPLIPVAEALSALLHASQGKP